MLLFAFTFVLEHLFQVKFRVVCVQMIVVVLVFLITAFFTDGPFASRLDLLLGALFEA